MLSILSINELGPTDIAFFIVCAAIVAIIVAIYFLIPVFNKKQYQEQRDNLKKREEAFKSNMRQNASGVLISQMQEAPEQPAQAVAEEQPIEQEAQDSAE